MTATMNRISVKELNGNQRIAWRNIKEAANFIIGALENGLEDEPEGSEEYEAYKANLADHEALVNQIEFEAKNGEFAPGFAGCRVLKEMRFAGNEFIRKATNQIVTDMGY